MSARHLKKRWIDRRVYEYFAVNIAPFLGWRDPILVYQMGKVGSSSIRNSLFRSRDPRTRLVLMSHEFYPIRNRDVQRIDIEADLRPYVIAEIEHDKQVFQRFSRKKRRGWRFRERFYTQRIYQAYVKPGGPLRVITLVREPVANNISMFFEVFDHYAQTTFEASTMSVDEMIALFLDRYMHRRPLTWFDAELKTTLGIDVFRHPFDTELGYAVIRQENVALLVLKMELDDHAKAEAVAGFLGLQDLELVRSNVSRHRPHGDAYAEFRRRIRVPARLLEDLYESKYARHFYSESERAAFRQRWRCSQ